MRLRHIEIFEALRRTGSLTDAAAALHISQPAASKLLAHAEAQLGFKLFQRIKGRLVATHEAEVLWPEIARLNQDLANVRKLAASLRDKPNGHLRIGCAPALGLGLLPQVVRASREARPGLGFDIQTHHSAELVEGLQTRELDLAITFDAHDYPGLTRTSLGDTRLVHLGRRPGNTPISLTSLAGATLIVLDARDTSGALLQMALDAQDINPDVAIQVQTHYVACALAEAGCGEAIVDAITARAMLRPGMSMRRLDPDLRVPINLLMRSQDPVSSLQEELIQRLRVACWSLEADENTATPA